VEQRYDLFISYSSKDRAFVERLADALRRRGLKLWYDQWEMRPGDRLRDRINSGIASSRYFLVALTPSSVAASWVRTELDAAMIRELERQRVIVIPIVFGDLDRTALPPDLKGKHYVDFRDEASFDANVERIVALFELEKRERRRLLSELRAGALAHPDPVEYLRGVAMRGHDQTQEVAALTGLQKHVTPAAVLAVAERMLDTWGIAAIKRAIVSASKLRDAGGLAVLAATLFYDDRFIEEKLDRIRAAVGGLKSLTDQSELYLEPSSVNRWLAVLRDVPLPDVSHGATFGAQFEGTLGWRSALIVPPPAVDAEKYMEQRIPGITRLFASRLRRNV
jgi:hypothetical protein